MRGGGRNPHIVVDPPRSPPPPQKGYFPRSNQGTAGFPDGRDPRRGVRDDLPPARGAEGAGEAACGNFLGEGDPREYLGNVVKSQGRAFISSRAVILCLR